ncbi:hypothetical protein D3C73_749830 [compost metagenome]
MGDHARLACGRVDGGAQGGGVQRLSRRRHDQGAAPEGAVARRRPRGQRLERRADAHVLTQQGRQHARGVQVAPVDDIGVGVLRPADAAGCDGRFGHGGPVGGDAAQAVALQPIGQGDRIGGAAVDAALGRWRPVEDGVDQAELRLGRGHDIGAARLIGASVLRHPLGQRVDLDVVGQQQVQRLARQARIGRVAEDEGLAGMASSLFDGRTEEVALEGLQPGALGDGAADGGQADIGLVADGEGEGQRAIGRVLHQAARTGLFDRHPDPAVEVGIGRAVDRREVVEDLARVIERAEAIQRLGVIPGQRHVPLIAGARQQRAFHAGGRGLEIIGAARAHLVEVDLDVGAPTMEGLQLGARLFLRHRQPVAVQVGEIVVGAPGGPGLDVLLVQRIRDGGLVLPGVVPVGGAVAAVGVLGRIDDDHGLVQPVQHLGRAPGGEVVGGQQGRLAAGGLIAVDAVEQADDDRGVGPRRRTAGIARRDMGALNLVDPALIGARGDDHGQQGPLFIAAADFLDRHPIRQACQFAQIVHDAVVAGVVRADRIAEEGFRRPDGWVEIARRRLREEIGALG